MSENTIVRVKDLKKYYQTASKTLFSEARYVKANDGITLDIKEGETLGLVGESGSGKSTLGKVLLQLYNQTDGSTYYYGRTLEDLAPQYVFKIIKDLEKDVKSLEANRIDRRKVKAQLAKATNSSDKAKLDKEFNLVDKKIDEFFDTTVKVFGGLIFSEDLSETSKTINDWYVSRGKVIKLSKQVTLEELALSALEEDEDTKESKLDKTKAKLQVAIDNLKIEEAKTKELELKIAEIRETAKLHEKYERYEERKDLGIDLPRLTEKEVRSLRTDLQIIFQDPYSSLNPRMTVAQIIGEALVAHGMYMKNTQKLTNYISKVMVESGLEPHMMHRYPHQFSGGQRQRIGIARALALNPKFIVCDEAVSALDVSIQTQIIDLLRDLKAERNLTYLFISHDLGVVRFISDRIAVMYKGHVVELASTKDIFDNPQHPYTQKLLRAIPRISDKELEFKNDRKHKVDFTRYIDEDLVDGDWVEVNENHFVACRDLEKEVI